jgi:predicted transcriptional regulator
LLPILALSAYDDRSMKVAKTLRESRETVGISLTKLASRSSVSRWRLLEHETGNLELKPEEISRLIEIIRQIADARIVALRQLVEGLEAGREATS